jgi:hypothetical protein
MKIPIQATSIEEFQQCLSVISVFDKDFQNKIESVSYLYSDINIEMKVCDTASLPDLDIWRIEAGENLVLRCKIKCDQNKVSVRIKFFNNIAIGLLPNNKEEKENV